MKNTTTIIILRYMYILALLPLSITFYELYNQTEMFFCAIPGLFFAFTSALIVYQLVDAIKIQWRGKA